MFVERFDHINIITPRFSETLEFYEKVMQFEVAPSPIGRHGAHLRDASGAASLHVVGVTADNLDFLLTYNLAHRTREETDPTTGFSNLKGSAAVDHIALKCNDFVATVNRLEDMGIPYRYFFVEMTQAHQIFIRDPNGIILELLFYQHVPQDVLARLNRGRISQQA